MDTTPLEIRKDPDGVCTLVLDQPARPVVVLDRELITRVEKAIRALPRTATGLVLASASQRVFIAGADLKTIHELSESQLDTYLAYGQTVFGMIANLPYPTAAAINGAALGGGLEIAMHCDALIAAPGAKPYPVGLPEAGLKICPGWGGTNLLPARMDPAEAIRRTATGETMMFDDAVAAGLFDDVAGSSETLLDAAKAWVRSQPKIGARDRDGAPKRWLGRTGILAGTQAALDAVRAELPGTGSARAVAEAVEAGLNTGWRAALDVERRRLIELSKSDEGRAAIETFLARSVKK